MLTNGKQKKQLSVLKCYFVFQPKCTAFFSWTKWVLYCGDIFFNGWRTYVNYKRFYSVDWTDVPLTKAGNWVIHSPRAKANNRWAQKPKMTNEIPGRRESKNLQNVEVILVYIIFVISFVNNNAWITLKVYRTTVTVYILKQHSKRYTRFTLWEWAIKRKTYLPQKPTFPTWSPDFTCPHHNKHKEFANVNLYA